MNFYEMKSLEGYEYPSYPEEIDVLELGDAIACRKKGDPWKPPIFLIISTQGKKKLKSSDCLGTAPHLFFSTKAIDALRPYFEANGELLPVNIIDGDPVWIFDPQKMDDAIDFEKCDNRYFPSGNYMQTNKFVFFEEKTKGIDILSARSFKRSALFSQNFVDAWNEVGLTGARFIKRTD